MPSRRLIRGRGGDSDRAATPLGSLNRILRPASRGVGFASTPGYSSCDPAGIGRAAGEWAVPALQVLFPFTPEKEKAAGSHPGGL
jgi:hypothetical protein